MSNDFSRRKFLESIALGGAASVSLPLWTNLALSPKGERGGFPFSCTVVSRRIMRSSLGMTGYFQSRGGAAVSLASGEWKFQSKTWKGRPK
jgi:hypothetical protein